jgi:hypothetical protein
MLGEFGNLSTNFLKLLRSQPAQSIPQAMPFHLGQTRNFTQLSATSVAAETA